MFSCVYGKSRLGDFQPSLPRFQSSISVSACFSIYKPYKAYCTLRNEMERNEMKRNEMERNEMKRNEMKRNETKRNEKSVLCETKWNEKKWKCHSIGRFTRHNFVACDKLKTSLRHESFRVNQTYNLLTIVAYDTKNVVGFWNMF